MLSDNSKIILFGNEDSPTACVHVQNKSQIGYIGMLTVDPTKQGRGIGTFVLNEAEKFIKQEFKPKAIQMWASIMNSNLVSKRSLLIAYYQRRGYKLTDKREPFPYGQPQYGIPKQNDLEFIVLEKQL